MANRLHIESSPYLLQHAGNPVDWYPWGAEAFERAKESDRPIFLSIGYAACHWCHVMAHESFEDPLTAELMNEHFINIKVDREERPDVDTIYMNALTAISGQGGWPLSMFLTPEGKPFYGGTYFPPIRRYNIPSFREVLLYLHEQWDNNRESILESSENLTQHLNHRAQPGSEDRSLDPDVLDEAVKRLFESYDWNHGGWGTAPKFPASSAIELLLLRYHRQSDQHALDMASHALDHMRRGGIHDQIGGGFHRYSVDEKWLVPHFEKMLYDNALLLRAYLHHWQITRNQDSRVVVEQLIDFLVREMRHEKGGFFSSLDADSEGEEGTFYIWDWNDFREACSDTAYPEFAIAALGVTEGGNFEGRNILSRTVALAKLAQDYSIDEPDTHTELEKIRIKLLARRADRPRPATDDKIITAWNGMLLIALAETARALSRPDILELAQNLAAFLLDELIVDSKLQRTWRDGKSRFTAFLEDHAALGLGLVALYQADFNPEWLKAARFHASEILENFSDTEGGFFDTRADHEPLITRPKSVQDTPTPSGNTLAIELFLKLAALDGADPWTAPALKALATMQETAASYPSAFAGWLNALDFAMGPQLQLAITGDQDSSEFSNLLNVSNQAFFPRLVLAAGDPDDDRNAKLLASRPAQDQGAMAYLCEGFTCQLPTPSPDALKQQIESALVEPNHSH